MRMRMRMRNENGNKNENDIENENENEKWWIMINVKDQYLHWLVKISAQVKVLCLVVYL